MSCSVVAVGQTRHGTAPVLGDASTIESARFCVRQAYATLNFFSSILRVKNWLKIRNPTFQRR